MALDRMWLPLGTLVCAAALPFLAAPTTAQGQDRDQERARTDVEACPLCDAGAELVARFGLREAASPVRERPGWAPPVRIVTTWGEEIASILRAVAPNAEVITVSEIDAVPGVIGDADIFFGGCRSAIVEAAENLKWIQIGSAGAEGCARIPELQERGILVTNMQRIYGAQIAEHAIAMMFGLARQLPRWAEEQVAGGWEPVPSEFDEDGFWEIGGKTMLVVGLGGIGTEVAQRAHGLGMRVIATRNSRREGPDYVEYVGLAHEVLELAARADVVVNAAPLTPDTRGMFDAEFFATMKETAVFINVGRGASAVTADLVAALESGEISGAGLDVTDPEPLPSRHPLWSMPNVILTPHIAASTDRFNERFGILLAENLRRYVAGDPMLSVVNLARGY